MLCISPFQNNLSNHTWKSLYDSRNADFNFMCRFILFRKQFWLGLIELGITCIRKPTLMAQFRMHWMSNFILVAGIVGVGEFPIVVEWNPNFSHINDLIYSDKAMVKTEVKTKNITIEDKKFKRSLLCVANPSYLQSLREQSSSWSNYLKRVPKILGELLCQRNWREASSVLSVFMQVTMRDGSPTMNRLTATHSGTCLGSALVKEYLIDNKRVSTSLRLSAM